MSYRASNAQCGVLPYNMQQNLIPLSFPAGVDKRFPKGTIYPGVIALYRALTEARHYRRMHRIQSQRMFGNLAANGSPAPADSASVVSAQDSVQVDQVCTVPEVEMRSSCCAVLCHAMPCHAMLCCVMLCIYVMYIYSHMFVVQFALLTLYRQLVLMIAEQCFSWQDHIL